MGNKKVEISGRCAEPDVSKNFRKVGDKNASVFSFSVAETPRIFDKKSNEWRDGVTTWYKVTVWNKLADRASEIIKKGMPVIISGVEKTTEFENRNGEMVQSIEITADSVGVNIAEFGSITWNPDDDGSRGKSSRSSSSSDSSSSSRSSSQSRPAQKPAQKPAPKDDDFDLSLDDDDSDDDFNDLDLGDI